MPVEDNNKVKIKVGDVIMYGYNMYGPIMVGIVTKTTDKTFTYSYMYKSFYNNEVRKCSSICRQPKFSIVVNNIAKYEEFQRTFRLNELDLPYSTEMGEVTPQETNQVKSGITFGN